MFTGIITDVGRIDAVEPFGDGIRAAIVSAYDPASIPIGASIACSGCCLTVTTLAPHGNGVRFTVDASAETLDKTTVGAWAVGSRINLERSLKMGDELGGHLVSGHVDGRAEIVSREDGEDMSRFTFRPPEALLPLIATKGSVALDGTSLTVNDAGDTFSVAMIPHTLAVTTWRDRQPGDLVNIEIDTIARYVARLAAMRPA
ncbi:riboflavin synthase [Acuticoccus sp. MNP-M23]|uniref:riboflavin synthase n=1 Tax=Acuticoccus sp. MNP-M23 TaxID=3072793 RepID=UPI002814A2B1|nr:riboflavin synthase [Acuticoccus sp. MNP-M23]WMS43353.1 riboflavin synthase [Acuticoccus sp. MNP-M23]